MKNHRDVPRRTRRSCQDLEPPQVEGDVVMFFRQLSETQSTSAKLDTQVASPSPASTLSIPSGGGTNLRRPVLEVFCSDTPNVSLNWSSSHSKHEEVVRAESVERNSCVSFLWKSVL